MLYVLNMCMNTLGRKGKGQRSSQMEKLINVVGSDHVEKRSKHKVKR